MVREEIRGQIGKVADCGCEVNCFGGRRLTGAELNWGRGAVGEKNEIK